MAASAQFPPPETDPHDYYVPDVFTKPNQQRIGEGCFRALPTTQDKAPRSNWDMRGVWERR